MLWTLLAVGCSPQRELPAVEIIPDGGNVSPGTFVTLRVSGPYEIIYTLDGTPPDPDSSPIYRGPFQLWTDVEVRAAAVNPSKEKGPESRAYFQVDALFPKLRFDPPPGNYYRPVKVKIEADERAEILYSLRIPGDRWSPFQPYRGPIPLARDTEVRAVAIDRAKNRTPIVTGKYNFPPSISVFPPGGAFIKPTYVTAGTDEKAKLRYRTFQGIWSHWKPFPKKIEIKSDIVIEFIATDTDNFSSQPERYFFSFFNPLKAESYTRKVPPYQLIAVGDPENTGQNAGFFVNGELIFTYSWERGLLKYQLAAVRKSKNSPRWVRTWDLDGDSLSELLVGTESGGLEVWQYSSPTELTLSDRLTLFALGREVRMVIPLDFDADGQLDLFLLDARPGKSALFRRTIDGYRPIGLTPTVNVPPLDGISAYFNGDPYPDLIVLSQNPGPPLLLFGDGKGNFIPAPLGKIFQKDRYSGIKWLAVARADLDGDGDSDIALVGHPAGDGKADGIILLIENIGGRDWRPLSELKLPPPAKEIHSLSVTDLDADNTPEVIVWRKNAPPIVISNIFGAEFFAVPGEKFGFPSTGVGTVIPPLQLNRGPGIFLNTGGNAPILQLAVPHPYLSFLLLGIRGNRSALETRLVLWSSLPLKKYLYQTGPCCTGPNQQASIETFLLNKKFSYSKFQIIWSDGSVKEFESLPVDKRVMIRP